MKFSISNPPPSEAGLEAMSAWLYELYELLGVMFESLDTDNFSDDVRQLLDKITLD